MDNTNNNERAVLLVSDMLSIQKGLICGTEEEQMKLLAAYIEELIHNDFSRLLQILYRVDVPEEKLKKALAENKESLSSGEIIARLLVERQVQKIELRAKYSSR
ncbi:hypothetical protein RCC89_05520 [Cytophagaceae bacterium ABcell3]|nr:hypothetical protein RCC89_05520 [Cytophagaceae bacterium ABcell3]